jgi:hypothetical protein
MCAAPFEERRRPPASLGFCSNHKTAQRRRGWHPASPVWGEEPQNKLPLCTFHASAANGLLPLGGEVLYSNGNG